MADVSFHLWVNFKNNEYLLFLINFIETLIHTKGKIQEHQRGYETNEKLQHFQLRLASKQ